MTAGRKRVVARLLLIAALSGGLTTGVVSPGIGQTSAESIPSGLSREAYLSQATDLADGGDVAQAKAMADRYASMYSADPGDSPGKRGFMEGQLAYAKGDYAAAATGFETAKQDRSLVENAGGRFYRLLGSTYLRQGRVAESIEPLETALAIYRRLDAVSKTGPVLTRLGEAYRRAGRTVDARTALDQAKMIEFKGGKGLAHIQIAMLDFASGDMNGASTNSQTAIEILRGPPAKPALAEAYVMFGRYRFKTRPEFAGEAWRYVDMAREIDPNSPSLPQLVAELPTRLTIPPFEPMRPPFAFNRDIENGAMSCYETAPERESYLASISAEVERITVHIQNLDNYKVRLNNLIAGYNNQGYIQDYQGNAAGRGYTYGAQTLAEINLLANKRAGAAARLEALRNWYNIARVVPVPCGNARRGRLAQPGGYQSRLPVNDGYF